MSQEYGVIGLGQFGRAVACSLARQGHAVLAIDQSYELVEAVQDEVDAAVRADTTDEETLRGLGLERLSCVVVAIGAGSMEGSILTTTLLRQFGVPRIVARATSTLHARVLHAVGAHEVLNPEQEMGERLAQRLGNPGIVDQLAIGDACLAEIEAPASFIGKSLLELALRKRHGISVLAISRAGHVDANPRPDDAIASGDILMVLGSPQAVRRLTALS